jgi:hypothetical protein
MIKKFNAKVVRTTMQLHVQKNSNMSFKKLQSVFSLKLQNCFEELGTIRKPLKNTQNSQQLTDNVVFSHPNHAYFSISLPRVQYINFLLSEMFSLVYKEHTKTK